MSLIGKKSKATHPLAWTRQPSHQKPRQLFYQEILPILSFSAAVRFRFRLRSPALISPVRRVATEPGKLPTYFSRAQSVAGSRIEPKTQMIRSEFQGLLFPRLWTNSTTSVRASRHWASPARPATRKADLLRIIGNSFLPSSRTREARAAFRPTF